MHIKMLITTLWILFEIKSSKITIVNSDRKNQNDGFRARFDWKAHRETATVVGVILILASDADYTPYRLLDVH